LWGFADGRNSVGLSQKLKATRFYTARIPIMGRRFFLALLICCGLTSQTLKRRFGMALFSQYVRRGLPQYIGIITALLATILYFTTGFTELLKSRRDSAENRLHQLRAEEFAAEQQQMMKDLQSRNQQLTKQLSDLARSSDSKQIPRELGLLRQGLSETNATVVTVQNQVNALNNAIESSPEKALTIPLLRKDVEDLKTATQRDLDSIRAEMGRNYDLNKWLIGLILAAVLGTVINSAMQSKSNKRDSVP
jgi:hypothetical protein